MNTQDITFEQFLQEWRLQNERLLRPPLLVVGNDYKTCGHCRAVGAVGASCPRCGREL